jgi:uncharacterized membrane protein YphA (DoxX/SURF4 family)
MVRPSLLGGTDRNSCHRRGSRRQLQESLVNIALWIVAGLLAIAYLAGGGGKVVLPKDKLIALGPSAEWAEDFSAAGVKAIGALEVLAAVGLILPAVLDIAPVLVPLAASGLVLIMIGATITRIRRREYTLMALDLVYLALAAFMAWGRFGPYSFTD